MTKIPFEARYAFQFILFTVLYNIKFIYLSAYYKYCIFMHMFGMDNKFYYKIIKNLTRDVGNLIISLPITNYQLPIR